MAHFPFGFGLSYTSFTMKCISFDKDEEKITLHVNVKNTGTVDGDEVIQIYVGSDNKDIDRPVKVLKGFKRVSVKAGQTIETEVEVLVDDIKFYNPANGQWELDESYTIYLGCDSKNVTEAGKIAF